MAVTDIPRRQPRRPFALVEGLLAPGRRGATMLTLGTLASGVLAYAFNALAARALGPEAYGPIAVLWSALFLLSVVLFRPIEQTLSRGIAERAANGEDARAVMRSTIRLATVIAVVAALSVVAAWEFLGRRLFDGQDMLTAALAVGILGYAVSFVVRGIASGFGRFGDYGLLLFADGLIRVVLAAPLVFFASPALAAVALAAAAIGGAVVPLLRPAWRRIARTSAGGSGAGAIAPFRLRHAVAFAGPALVIAAADQILVSGGALLVSLAGGPGAAVAAGTVFAATMLVRAPVFLFQGFAAALLPSLTAFQARGAESEFRKRILLAVGGLGAFAAALTIGTLVAGPESMRLLYGPGFEVDRIDLTILALGVGFYLAGATLSQAVLARGMASTAAAVWGVGAASFIVIELVLPGEPLHRVSLAFAGAAFLIASLLFVVVVRAGTHNARSTSRTSRLAGPLRTLAAYTQRGG